MSREHALLLRGRIRWSFLSALGSLVLTGALTAATPPSASPSAAGTAGSAHVIATISLGRHLACNVATDPLTHMVYVTEPTGLAVINGRTDKLVTTVRLPGAAARAVLIDRLRNVATDPLTGRVYVTDAAQHSVLVIDERTDRVVATIPVGGQMHWIATDPLTGRVYVQDWRRSSVQVAVIDGRADTVVARIPENGLYSLGITVNPLTDRVYVAGTSVGGVLVIDGRANKVVSIVPDTGGDQRIAADPLTNTIYADLPDADGPGYLQAINGRTNTVTAYPISLRQGVYPLGIATDPLTHFVYVANYGNNIVVINGRTNKVVGFVPVGRNPNGVATDPLANRVYVTNIFSHSVSVLAGSR
ncbi:MAG TPA: YncE family protein [Streptosporangiaceae bacterium]|nr:YncE family protein [Streptosporangiaceae bacterium]